MRKIATWYCCRQRAGPLVKECRALRPRLAAEGTATDRKAKLALKRAQNGTLDRRQVDKLELRLAQIGRTGIMYTLTFDNAHLPGDFKGVRRSLDSFHKRAHRWRASLGKPPDYDYIYCVEGLHGNRRYHVHYIVAYDDLSPAEMLPSESGDWPGLWRNGIIDMEYVLQPNKKVCLANNSVVDVDRGGFRRIAEYLNKERTDGFVIPIGRHPWSCSRSLVHKLPPAEKWKDTSGVIDVPKDAVWVRRGYTQNDFGAYYYASWIEPRARDRLESRACARDQS